MSYRFLSFKEGHAHEEEQWHERSIDRELDAFEGRTLLRAFDAYVRPGDRVLEAGCGLGAWCEWFRRQGHDVLGLEYSPPVVAQARRERPDVPVELGDVTDIEHADNSFDVYISLGVLEHFEEGPSKALSEARRVLRPGGRIFITVPLLTPLRRFLAHPVRDIYFFLRKLRGKGPGLFWEYRYTRGELARFIREAGFSIISEGVDDYERDSTSRHIGLWADWFPLRKRGGRVWELNGAGKIALRLLKRLPQSWYCSGWLIVAKVDK